MANKSTPNHTDRIEQLLEALVRMRLAEVFKTEVTQPDERRLYDITGTATRNQLVKKKTGLSAGKISALWQRWHSLGILSKNGKFYNKLMREESTSGENNA